MGGVGEARTDAVARNRVGVASALGRFDAFMVGFVSVGAVLTADRTPSTGLRRIIRPPATRTIRSADPIQRNNNSRSTHATIRRVVRPRTFQQTRSIARDVAVVGSRTLALASVVENVAEEVSTGEATDHAERNA